MSTSGCISARATAHAFLFISIGKGSSGKHICASARRIPECAEVQSRLQELSKLSKGSAGALKPAGNSTGTSGRDVRRLLLISARSRHQWDEEGEIAANARNGGGGRRMRAHTHTNRANFGRNFARATTHLCVIHQLPVCSSTKWPWGHLPNPLAAARPGLSNQRAGRAEFASVPSALASESEDVK